MKASPRASPDVVAYSTVISALAKQMEKSEEYFHEIDRIFELLRDMQMSSNVIPNDITFATISTPLIKWIIAGNSAAFEIALDLLVYTKDSSYRVLFPRLLDALKSRANKGDESVVEKAIKLIKTAENNKLNLSPDDLRRSKFSLSILVKALGSRAPPGSVSELHRVDRPWKVLLEIHTYFATRLFLTTQKYICRRLSYCMRWKVALRSNRTRKYTRPLWPDY
jgi:hypothetical protein